MTLAKRIRDCRYAKGWGPDELASRAEISRTALYQIESGKTELPRAATLRRIARALDVSVDVLLADADINAESLATTGRPVGPGLAAFSSHPNHRASFLDEPEPFPLGDDFDSDQASAHVPLSRGDLAKKFHELLESPMCDDVVRFIEATHHSLEELRIHG